MEMIYPLLLSSPSHLILTLSILISSGYNNSYGDDFFLPNQTVTVSSCFSPCHPLNLPDYVPRIRMEMDDELFEEEERERARNNAAEELPLL